MMSFAVSRLAGSLLVSAIAGTSGIAPASAQATQPSTGKPVTIVVGGDVGTGFDVYARVLGRHVNAFLPGKPTIIIQNMPGAGSVKAAEYMYTLAPKDGSVFAILFPGALVEPLIGNPADYRYDPRKFGYLGTADSGTRLCLTYQTSKIKTFEDARRIPSIIAATQRGSSTSDYPYMLNAFAGTKFKIVAGYKSTGDILLAMERGEADGVCGHELSSVKSQRPDWIGSDKAHAIVQMGVEPNAELTKLGVPEVWPFVSKEDRPVVDLIISQQVFGRPFVAPPGLPAAQLKLLRDAFMATLADPGFLQDARKSGLDVNPKDGPQVAALIDRMFGSPKELTSRILSAIRP